MSDDVESAMLVAMARLQRDDESVGDDEETSVHSSSSSSSLGFRAEDRLVALQHPISDRDA